MSKGDLSRGLARTGTIVASMPELKGCMRGAVGAGLAYVLLERIFAVLTKTGFFAENMPATLQLPRRLESADRTAAPFSDRSAEKDRKESSVKSTQENQGFRYENQIQGRRQKLNLELFVNPFHRQSMTHSVLALPPCLTAKFGPALRSF